MTRIGYGAGPRRALRRGRRRTPSRGHEGPRRRGDTERGPSGALPGDRRGGERRGTLLAENVVRVAMHPADQVVAFLKLSEAGVTVAAIAARFGVTERLVEQRLSLGGVAPELLDAYRAQEMDLDTLKAFTVTIDHARQKAVWEQVKEQGYGPSGWQVKRMLTEESVPAASAVARFVGMEAYEAAGGTLTRDLFAGEDGSGTWFDDPVLLNELATEKLRAAADDLTTRWKWAKTMVEADWSAVAGFGRISPEPGVPTEEEKAERESLRARHDELVNMDEDEWPDELIKEAEAIKALLRTIAEAVESRAAFRAQDYAIAGCIATVGHDGALKVIKGLVKPEDMPERTGAGGEDNRTEPGRMDAPLITEPLATPPIREQGRARKPGSGSDSQTTCAPSARPWSRRICPGTSRRLSTSPWTG